MLKTPNANVKYTVHSSEDRNGLPDIELSVCKEASTASLLTDGATVTAANCAKTNSACAGGSAPLLAKNAVAKATPSELADIAKLIKEHERDNEEMKKQKETGKCSGSQQRAFSTESTLHSQVQKWKKMISEQKPKSDDKVANADSANMAKKWCGCSIAHYLHFHLHFKCSFIFISIFCTELKLICFTNF